MEHFRRHHDRPDSLALREESEESPEKHGAQPGTAVTLSHPNPDPDAGRGGGRGRRTGRGGTGLVPSGPGQQERVR